MKFAGTCRVAELGQLLFFDAEADNEVADENGALGGFGEREACVLPGPQGCFGDVKGGGVWRESPREDSAAVAVAADTLP